MFLSQVGRRDDNLKNLSQRAVGVLVLWHPANHGRSPNLRGDMKHLLASILFALTMASPAAAEGACSFGNIRSLSSDAEREFTVENRSANRTMLLYWIDFDGKPVLYAEIGPRQKTTQGTYFGHLWTVESAGNRCEAIFVVASNLELRIR